MRTLGVTLGIAGTQASSPHRYGVEFFDLQLQFAARVAALTGVTLPEAVGSHTNIFVRLAMGPRFDPYNTEWARFASLLARARDPLALTYDIYLQRAHMSAGPQVSSSAGCFSYANFDQDRVRLHFNPGEQQSVSPLSPANRLLRKQELTKLLSQAVSISPNVNLVVASWLYNLGPYRDIFPRLLLDRLKPIDPPYQRMPLWGQFLHRNGMVRTEPAKCFLSRLAGSLQVQELGNCFPLPVLSATVQASSLLAQVEYREVRQGDA